jgi:hypothetical protein
VLGSEVQARAATGLEAGGDVSENADARIQAICEEIAANHWTTGYVWKLTGHRYIPFGTQQCERCGNEELSQLFLATDEEGRTLEVGSTCITRLCPGQRVEICKARKALKQAHREFVRQASENFTWTEWNGNWRGRIGMRTIEAQHQAGGWHVLGVKLGRYFRTAKEAMKAAEKELFKDA